MNDGIDKTTTSTKPLEKFKWVEWVFINLNFLGLIVVLVVIYIANAHYSERKLRKIDKIKKEVTDYKAQYLNLKQSMMSGSTQSEFAKRLETQKIQPLNEVPKKLTIVTKEDK
jgi:hypothetical protein